MTGVTPDAVLRDLDRRRLAAKRVHPTAPVADVYGLPVDDRLRLPELAVRSYLNPTTIACFTCLVARATERNWYWTVTKQGVPK